MTLSLNPNNSKTRADGGGGAAASVLLITSVRETAAAEAAALSTAPLRPRPEGCAQQPELQVNDRGTYAQGRMRSGECALTALPLTSQAAPGSHYLTLIPSFTYPFLPPHFPRALP